MFAVDAIRPQVLVELGTFTGVSYCAFCQAVQALDLGTRCYAIDTWAGDAHTGSYGPEILANLRQHHDTHYGSFSKLLQSNFDEALEKFVDGSIDLLHIDGCHSYESIKHDFESWLPKMSVRGVMLLHDTNVRMRHYDVWQLWQELVTRYPHFEFVHEHGLGVLAVGTEIPERLRPLFDASLEKAAVMREYFHQLGLRFNARLACEQEIQAKDYELRQATIRLNTILGSRTWQWVNRYAQLKARLGLTGRIGN